MNPSSWLQTGLRLLVRGYQLLFSHWLNARCRYTPSCSNYALQALEAHGGLTGGYLATRRILRCNPFCLGGHDPVPTQAPRLFTTLLGRRPPSTSNPADP